MITSGTVIKVNKISEDKGKTYHCYQAFSVFKPNLIVLIWPVFFESKYNKLNGIKLQSNWGYFFFCETKRGENVSLCSKK